VSQVSRSKGGLLELASDLGLECVERAPQPRAGGADRRRELRECGSQQPAVDCHPSFCLLPPELSKLPSSATTAIVAPTLRVTNQRPTLAILSVRFLGSAVYARFRICDDSMKNLTIIETDSRPGQVSYTRRFTTLLAPRPCGGYTSHWTPAARFRGAGRYTVTLRARDKSGFTSLPARRSFSRG